jgi:hypothetical protein
MDEAAADRERRARDRSGWRIRRYALGEEPDDNLAAETTAAERVGMVWELSLRSWLLSGRELPDYDRRCAPGRVVRPPR